MRSTIGTVDLHPAEYGITVESMNTYRILLQGTGISTDIIMKQFLVFDVTPKDAMITVNGEPWPVNDGYAQKYVDFGTYEYRIEAKDYHTFTSNVDVYDPDNKVTVKKSLEPAFGFLKIEGDYAVLSKANIYIDNAKNAEVLRTPQRLGSGQHTVRILHSMYKPYEQTVTIKDNKTNTLKVNLNANFASITLAVDAEAEIWVNGEKKGVRTWTGNLEAGSYVIECRMKDCKSTRVEKIITADMNGQTIAVEVPQPLTGMLVLNSTPAMAEIYIDGERKGETPMRINKLTVGKHSLRLVKKGYKFVNKTFNIEDGKTLELEEKLEAEAPVVKNSEKPKEEKKVEPKPRKEKPAKSATPTVWFTTANFAYSLSPQASFGVTFGQVKRFGWFVSAMSNFGFKAMQYDYTADADGLVDDNILLYNGESCSTRLSFLAGGMMRVVEPVYVRVGVGYGMRVKSWYTEDGYLVKMSDDSWSGVDLTAGVQLHLSGLVLSLDAVTTSFKDVEAKIGVGWSF